MAKIVKLPVMDGRVACPALGDIDLDRCSACPWLREVRSLAGGGVEVCCSGRRRFAYAAVE